MPNFFQAMKSEIGAALAVSAGVLLATGYAITWARLANEGLPTEAVLSALPKTFYLGVAGQSLILPLFVGVTLGIGFVLLSTRGHDYDELPSRLEWTGFGVALAFLASILANIFNPFATVHRSTTYAIATIIAGLVVVLVTYLIGRLARYRLDRVKTRKTNAGESLESTDRWTVIVAAVVVACVFAASLMRVVDARFAPRALAEAALFTDRIDCAKPSSTLTKIEPGCLVTGFYIGENSQWIYLVAPQETLVPGEPARKLPGRVYFVPRDSVRQIRLAKNLSSLPSAK